MSRNYSILFILLMFGVGVSIFICYVRRHRMPVVLLYHTVAFHHPSGLAITPDQFRQEMDWLAKHHKLIVPLNKILKHASDNAVALTFDSVTENEFLYVIPELRKRRWPATFFLCTASVNVRRGISLQHLQKLVHWGFSLESHSVSHPWLTEETEARLQDELQVSKRKIEAWTGQPVRYIAYPYGAVDDRVKRLTQTMGYDAGLAVIPGRAFEDRDPFAIRRVPIHPWIPLAWLTSGYYPIIREVFGLTSPHYTWRVYMLFSLLGVGLLLVFSRLIWCGIWKRRNTYVSFFSFSLSLIRRGTSE